jgi:hypothetical protein
MSATWAKFDVGYLGHPKLLGLEPRLVLLHVASILWTTEHLTDGYVPDRALIELSSRVDLGPTKRQWGARSLVDRGLWDECSGGWVVHDYAVHNRSSLRENVETNRARARERQERWRKQHGEI